MRTRILPRDEFDRLTGTELETVHPFLPEAARVIVVEDGDRIIGCWALVPILHAEGVWVAPEHRGKTSVQRRLWTRMFREAHEMGFRAVVTAAISDDVAALLASHGGVELPGRAYALTIGAPSCLQP